MDATVSLDAQALNLIIGLGLPLLVGIVTQRVTDARVKKALLAVLAIIAGALTTLQQNTGGLNVVDFLLSILVTYVAAQGGYTSVLKPSGIAAIVSDISDRIGVGLTIKADPVKVAIAEGTVVPAPAVVPVEQIVDTEGQQAEAIAEDPEPAPDDDEPLILYPGDPGYDDAEDPDDPVDEIPPGDVQPDDDGDESGEPYDLDPDDEVPVINADDLPREDPDTPV